MSDRHISRLEFLKLLGVAGLSLSLGAIGFTIFARPKRRGSASLTTSATAQSAGSWVLGQNTTTIAIHATYLHTGHILYIAGSGYHADHLQGPYEARLLHPATGFETVVPISADLFCHGSVHLDNGNVLIAGGTLQYDIDVDNCNGRWHGLKDAYEFDVASGQITAVQSMATGRWYPTLVILADGRVFTFNGYDEYGVQNRLVEVYNPATRTWSIKYDPNTNTSYCIGQGFESTCPGAGSPCYGGTPGNGIAPSISLYPRMHLMPNGQLVIVGNYPEVRSFDPQSGSFSLLNSSSTYRSYGTSVLLPLQNTTAEKGKILLVGGAATSSSPATKVVEIVDFNASTNSTPVIRTVQSLQYGRRFLVPVTLPDGKTIVFGGSSQGGTNYVYYPEMFDPVSETWTTLPAATVPRVYHTVALLLYDGTVWTAGSTPTRSVQELRTEIYRPWYYTQTRPSISGNPIVGGYGQSITIPTPEANIITSVSLLRLMSCTHHFEANQRFLWLQIQNKTSNSVTVAAPKNGNLAPPGYYMIHVLNSSGVPSYGKVIHVPGPGGGGGDTTPPGQVTGVVVSPAGSTQLNLSWNSSPASDFDHYDVHRSAVSGFTPSAANRIAQPITNSYSDTGLSISTTYYYVVAAVDTSGNVGQASTETSGTTGTLATFYDVVYPGDAVGPLGSSQASIRYGEEARVAASILVGKSLKTWKVYMRRVGTSIGNVTAAVRRSSDDAIVTDFNEVIDASTLSTSFAEKTFTLATPYIIQTGDRILIEYSGSGRVELSVWTTDQIDGANTRRVRYGTSYVAGNTSDIAGSMSSSSGDTTPPGQVTGVVVSPAGSTQLNLSWNSSPASDFDHYDVHRSAVSGFTPSAANRIAQPITNSYSDTGLSISTTYYYVVAAVDTSGNVGQASTETSGTTGTLATFYDVVYPGDAVGGLYTGASIRYGEEAVNASSALVGKSLKKWKIYLRKAGSASGPVNAVVRRSSDDSVVATFIEILEAASLPTSFASFDFTLASPYVIQPGDKLLVQYSGVARVDVSVWTVDHFDGSSTRRTRYTGTSYAYANGADVAGQMSG